MITKDKIKIYIRYHKDIDKWARSGTKKEKSIMNDNDWHLIDTLIQDILLVKRKIASAEFENNLNNKLKENCDEGTISQLRKIAEIKNS